jgi:hypothetical protein
MRQRRPSAIMAGGHRGWTKTMRLIFALAILAHVLCLDTRAFSAEVWVPYCGDQPCGGEGFTTEKECLDTALEQQKMYGLDHLPYRCVSSLPDHYAASTPVAVPAFYQIVEGRDGQAVWVPNASFVNFDECWAAVGRMHNPLNYYCLRYESVDRIRHYFPNN